LGLYVFCRRRLFTSCYELTPAFSQLVRQPTDLQLVANEAFPTERRVRCVRYVALVVVVVFVVVVVVAAVVRVGVVVVVRWQLLVVYAVVAALACRLEMR
jgi:hypothetical protein